MNVKGKKIAFLGDSITCGVGTSAPEKVYWRVLGEKTGAICKGYGISGTRIARQTAVKPDAIHDTLHFITRVNQIDKDTDIIFVFGGVNDFSHGDAPLGKKSDRRDDTFYGGCHLLYTKLVEDFPNSRIFVITPLHCCGEEDGYFNDSGRRNDGTLLDYVNAILEVAADYSIDVLDLYRTSGIQPRIAVQREMFMPDGVHPNDAGNEIIANKILAFLNGH